MAELWLLCEGPTDLPVLTAILVEVLAADIIPKAAGGSGNAPKAAAYVEQNQKDVSVSYLIDRDYRSRQVAEDTLTDGKRGFMWRRHSVESYLLEPAVIVAALRGLRATLTSSPGGVPRWLEALPEEPEVSAELRRCAEERVPQEAARMALQQLWEDLSTTAGRVQRRHPPELGQSAADEASCRSALLQEAARLIEMAQETVRSPHLTAAAIGLRYDGELARLRAPAYLDQREYLKDFHGRDLLQSFHRWLQTQRGAAKLSYKTFAKELWTALPSVYKANRALFGTDDFLDLANGVRALAGLPRL